VPVFDTTSVIGGFGQIIQNDWALGDDRQFFGDTQLSPNPPPPSDLDLTDAYFTLKSASTLPDADSLIQKHITQASTSAGVISAGLGGALSKLLIKIASGDYEGINDIVAGPAYPWDIRVITSAGVTLTVATGVVFFLQNDTQTNKSGTPAAFPNNGQPRFRGFTSQNPQLVGGFPGFYNAGDFFFNSNPANGNGSGWQCFSAGSPGTWNGFSTTSTLFFNNVNITIANSPYAVNQFNQFIGADTTTGDVDILLPAASGSGRVLYIAKTDATANNMNIIPNGVDTIDLVPGTLSDNIPQDSNTLIDRAVGSWKQI
jgi:hypothetical protein